MSIVRSITHWTGGTGRASAKDRRHYHRITEFDGRVVEGTEAIEDNIVTSDGDYAAHVRNLNTGSAGFAMAGMHGAREAPFDAGPYAINEVQFEAHCRLLAEFHAEYGVLPVTPQNCLTHAEVPANLGVPQPGKWDLTRLPFRGDLVGARAVGDYMRERVRAYLGAVHKPELDNRPTLRRGDRGAFVLDLQDQLRAAQFFSGKVDGIFGPLTSAAVRAFQEHAEIAVDGIVGPRTWAALRDAQPRAERDVSEADLRARGSRTVASADEAQRETERGARDGGIALAGAGVLAEAERWAGADTTLGRLSAMVKDNWPILAAGVVAYVIWRAWRSRRAIRRAIEARVDDARTGANVGR